MSKLSVMKGTTSSIQDTPYVEGKVYFVYENTESEDISIYADIDGVRRKIKEGVQRDELNNYLLKTDIAAWAKEATKPTYTAAEVGALSTSHPANGITSTDIDNWNAKSDTDEKLKVTATDVSGQYYPILSRNVTTAETKKYDEYFNFSHVNSKEAYLGIGKLNTALGQIRLYTAASGGKYGIITPGTLSGTRTYTLPDKSGIVALISDIPQIYSSTNTTGYLTMDTLPIYDGTVV